MQSAEPAYSLVTRAKIKVISVAEDDFRANFFEIVMPESFDGALSADWHECRRLHHSMWGVKLSTTGVAVGGGERKAERRR